MWEILKEMFLSNNVNFIRLCMETSCLCPSEGHEYGNWKLTKTCNLVLL